MSAGKPGFQERWMLLAIYEGVRMSRAFDDEADARAAYDKIEMSKTTTYAELVRVQPLVSKAWTGGVAEPTS